MIANSKIRNNHSKLLYSNVILGSKEENSDLNTHGNHRGRIFVEQVKLAAKRNIAIRNCYICRYHGDNWDASNDHSIFCKTFKKSCNSNEAANCERYRVDVE
jgi:hypothetical protein